MPPCRLKRLMRVCHNIALPFLLLLCYNLFLFHYLNQIAVVLYIYVCSGRNIIFTLHILFSISFRTSLHAVDIQGVHCTFKSFGDSMKPGGVVSNFVISVFIRHLNKKPNGHPDISKSQYFFSNIGMSIQYLYSIEFHIFSWYFSFLFSN
jgi:hypothetical protein